MYKVSVDSAATIRDLKAAGRSIGGSVSRAINRTLEAIQAAQRAHQRTAFTVRRASFVDRSVKITKFAKRSALIGEVAISSPGGRSDILTQHEEGGVKVAKDGRHIAVPDGARRGKSGIIPRAQRPRSFNFRPQGRGGRVMVGDRGTILVRRGDTGGIYQRRGRGQSSRLVRLFAFTARAQLKPRLRFHETADRVIRASLAHNVEAEIERALKNPRPG